MSERSKPRASFLKSFGIVLESLERRRLMSVVPLDPGFGINGRVEVDLGAEGAFTDMMVQSDGKILACGVATDGADTDAIVVRFDADGALDDSFGSDGIARYDAGGDESFASIALRSDGKIVVGGKRSTLQWLLTRFTSTGVIDTSFGGGDGVVAATGEISHVALQGSNIISADANGAIRRHNSAGAIDATFGTTGVAHIRDLGRYDEIAVGDAGLNDLAVGADGKITVVGSHGLYVLDDFESLGSFGIVGRFTADGELDASFASGDGSLIPQLAVDGDLADGVRGVALQPDGKILALINDAYNTVLLRYNSDGSVDDSFGPAPKDESDVGGDIDLPMEDPSAIALTLTGKALIVSHGYNEGIAVARLNENGSRDRTLALGGVAQIGLNALEEPAARAVAVTPDGNIVVAGSSSRVEDNTRIYTALLVQFQTVTSAAPSIGVVDRTLEVLGTDEAEYVEVKTPFNGDWLTVVYEDEPQSFKRDAFDEIYISLNGGDDFFSARTINVPIKLSGGAGNDKLIGGEANDLVGGNSGKDSLYGGGGNDRLNGHGGHDRLFGEAGADRIYGYDGNDRLDGGSSGDRLYGGDGVDTFFGQSGDDTLFSRDGIVESIYGASGADRADGDEIDARFSIEELLA
ncbi:MAG: hypothetical protein H0T11_07335 [Chthoniobacterales bacterium]|nr:hypothetical protein [Chthoniobacterales bacterium]